MMLMFYGIRDGKEERMQIHLSPKDEKWVILHQGRTLNEKFNVWTCDLESVFRTALNLIYGSLHQSFTMTHL